jgi:hypothetical protein
MKASLSLPLAVGLLAFGAGCIDNWQSFFVRDNKRLGEPPGCEMPTDPNATSLLGGVLDVSIRYSYAAYLFTENGLIARADPGRAIAESNGIFVHGAYLNYEPDPLCPAAMPAIETRFSNFIDPGGSATIGVGIVPDAIGQAIAGTVATCPGGVMNIVVTVEMFGQTQAGIDVITQPFDYPITVCSRCLVGCPVGLSCVLGCPCAATDPEVGELPCNAGQDDVLDCRLVDCG